MSDLGSFDGRDVIGTTIRVTHAGDGLSEALAVDPEVLELGDEVVVVLRCVVERVAFQGVKDTDALQRVHFLRAGDATIVEGAVVAEALDDQRERIVRAREEAEGVRRLDHLQRLHDDHEAGKHPVGGYDECDLCLERDEAQG